MNNSKIEEFTSTVEAFVSGRLSAANFERLIFDLFRTLDGEHGSDRYKVLNELFYAVEDYIDDPSLRDPGDLNEYDLRAAAKRALQSLSSPTGPIA